MRTAAKARALAALAAPSPRAECRRCGGSGRAPVCVLALGPARQLSRRPPVRRLRADARAPPTPAAICCSPRSGATRQLRRVFAAGQCRAAAATKRRRPIPSSRLRASARRRFTAVPTASAPATPATIPSTRRSSKKKKRAAQNAAAARPADAETTFTPVPTFALPAPAAAPPTAGERRCPEIYPKNAARRARRNHAAAARRTADHQSAARSASAGRRPTGRAPRAGSAAGILRLLREHAAADAAAAQHLRARNAAATAVADRRRKIPTRRSAFAPDRSCCCRRSICRAATAPIPNTGRRPVRRPRYFVVAPELQVASDWERHSLTADIVGVLYRIRLRQNCVPSLNVPYLNSKIDGRVDVTRDTQILLEKRYHRRDRQSRQPEPAGRSSPELPMNHDIGGTLGLAQQFNRLSCVAQRHVRPRHVRPFAADRRQSIDQRRPQLRPICRHPADRL